jgi:broad specificity phosphatase PhoE
LTRLWFVRHGEVESPLVGTFLGTTDAKLSDLGRHQAEAIKAYLGDADIDAVLASPRRRSLDTIAPLAKHKGMKIDVRKGLAEMDFGKWESKTWDQIREMDEEFANRWEADPATLACPDGESCDTFYERVTAELQSIQEEFKGRHVVLAAHAGTNRCILASIVRKSYLDCMVFAQDYGCVNAVGWGPSGFGQVALVNFVPGPRAERQGD